MPNPPPGVPAKMKRIKVHRWNEMKAQRNAYQIHKQAYQRTFKGSFKNNRDTFLRAPVIQNKNDSDEPPELESSSESEADHTGRPKIPGRKREECAEMPGMKACSMLPTEVSAVIDWSKIKYGKRKCFIIDSGASYHLTAYQSLTPEERLTVTKLDRPFELSTANGIVKVHHHVRLYMEIIRAEAPGATARWEGKTDELINRQKGKNGNGREVSEEYNG